MSPLYGCLVAHMQPPLHQIALSSSGGVVGNRGGQQRGRWNQGSIVERLLEIEGKCNGSRELGKHDRERDRWRQGSEAERSSETMEHSDGGEGSATEGSLEIREQVERLLESRECNREVVEDMEECNRRVCQRWGSAMKELPKCGRHRKRVHAPFWCKHNRCFSLTTIKPCLAVRGSDGLLLCCAACGLALFLLPMILFPFYSSCHSPMVYHFLWFLYIMLFLIACWWLHMRQVLTVPPTSPLSGYLAPGDVILSVDNAPIRNAQEWLKLNSLTYNVKLNNVNVSQRSGDFGVLNKMKGYCVPSFMMEESKIIELLENQHACPGELTAFVKSLCYANVTPDDGQSETGLLNRGWSMYCLNAKDVVKYNRCGDDWGLATTKRGGCTCSQDEFCLAPVQEPGLVWVEIAYSSPSHECLSHVQNRFPFSETSGVKETNCGGTFIFVGDVISMAHSIQLTSYQPRWGPQIVAYFPNILERILIWTFHVSLALALLNGLPVYFLDGESILDATLSHFTSLSPRKRNKVLRLCLLGGLLSSIIVCLRELF
ncbi:Membrane-bound transcription factor site-2 protease-like protein, partial [Mucuna pruriens]